MISGRPGPVCALLAAAALGLAACTTGAPVAELVAQATRDFSAAVQAGAEQCANAEYEAAKSCLERARRQQETGEDYQAKAAALAASDLARKAVEKTHGRTGCAPLPVTAPGHPSLTPIFTPVPASGAGQAVKH